MTTDARTHVFLSLPFLSKQYRSVPVEALEGAILATGAKRSWLFPASREEMLEARNLPAKYLEFDEDYKSLILRKEGQGKVYWHEPARDYRALSAFLEKNVDPTSNKPYLPLVLNEAWWQSKFAPANAKFTKDVQQIVSALKSGEFDNDVVMEVLYQSNPTLVPTLYWSET